MDWLRTTGGGRGGDQPAEQQEEAPGQSSSSPAHTTTSPTTATGKPSSALLAAGPFFGRVASSSTRRGPPSTTTEAPAPPAMASASSSASLSASTKKIEGFFTDLGASMRDSSASFTALLRDARDAVSILPPPAPERDRAAPALAPAPAASAAKARLAGLRLAVVEEAEGQTEQEVTGRPPFRMGPRTLVVAKSRDRPLSTNPEESGAEDEGRSIVMEWFRSVPGGALTPIPGLGSRTTRYRPTADDVGACVSVRASLLTPISLGSRSSSLQEQQVTQQQPQQQEPPFAAFAKAGPFALEEATAARLKQSLTARVPLTFKGLREPGSTAHHVYDLVLGPAGVELWSRPVVAAAPPAASKKKNKKAVVVVAPSPAPRQPLKEREPWSSSLSSDDEEDDGGSESSSDDEEEEGSQQELVGRGSYSQETLVAPHPLNPTGLLVQLPLFLLSPGPAAEEPTEADLLLQRALEVEGGQEERDLLALLWRAWRRQALGEGEGEEGAVHDAVLLAAQLKEQQGAGEGQPAIVVREPSKGEENGTELVAGQEEGIKSCRLSDSSGSGSGSDGSDMEEGTMGEDEAPGAVIWRLQQHVTDAREQLALERQQSQSLRRASSSGAVGRGLGGLLGMRRASGEERDREETIRMLKHDVEALHARVAELEAELHAAEEEAAEARDQLAEATARAASLGEEAERLRFQEEALVLQRASNEQALDLARGEMERLRAEAQGVREERDKDRAYFVGEVRDHAVRLEEAEAALIERERELSEAVKELAWAHEQWAGEQAAMTALEEQCAALRAEVKGWEEREERRREQRRREQQLELQERQRQQQLEATNPFLPVSPGELLEESRAQCAAAEALARALEEQLMTQTAAGEALQRELGAARQALESEREHTTVLLGERNSFRHRADSLARELSQVANRSLSHADSQSQQQQTAPRPSTAAIPRTFDEAATQLAAARAEAERLEEELEEVKALGAASFASSSVAGATPQPQPAGGGCDIPRPPSLRAMAAGAAGALRRKSNGGSGLSLFRLGSREEEDGAASTAVAPSSVRRDRSGSGYAENGRETEMQRLLRSLTQSVQDKETQLAAQRDRLRRLEALVREQGLRLPEGFGDDEEEDRLSGVGTSETPRTVDV